MTYRIVEIAPGLTMIRRESDGALIPIDDANTDYQSYLAWIAAGNSAPTE